MAFTPVREGQLTEDRLKWGYWWITHKLQLRRYLIIFLIVFDALTVLYAGWRFVDWFFLSGVQERQAIGQLAGSYTDARGLRLAAMAQEMQHEEPITLGAGEGVYDILGRATNPNTRYWAEFDYRFILSEDALVTPKFSRFFILPGESKYLTALGARSEIAPSPRLEIVNFQWHRLNAHLYWPDYATWSAARLNLQPVGAAVTPPVPGDALRVSRVKFELRNESAYSYRKVRSLVLLLAGDRIAAANTVTMDRLQAGETRPAELVWTTELPTVTEVQILPEVNILDPGAYLKPGE